MWNAAWGHSAECGTTIPDMNTNGSTANGTNTTNHRRMMGRSTATSLMCGDLGFEKYAASRLGTSAKGPKLRTADSLRPSARATSVFHAPAALTGTVGRLHATGLSRV